MASAQFDTATVLGTINDANGALVAGATVTLKNIDTGIAATTQTDTDGNFQFANVKIGNYRVSAEKQGFATAVAESVNVTVNARQRGDLTMQPGALTESVVVTAGVAVLETDASVRGRVVQRQQIVNLPLNGRSYANLVLLAPGVRESSQNGITTAGREAAFNVNGLRNTVNNFLLDGVDNNAYGTSNQSFSAQVVQVSPDAVQEFKVQTNTYSAEFGRSGGAVINASYRSGTNQFHGNLFDKTVLRGGYGIGYVHFNRLGSADLLATNFPQITRANITQDARNISGGLCAGNNFSGCFRTTQAGYRSGLPNNVTLYIRRDKATPYIQNWQLSIQSLL